MKATFSVNLGNRIFHIDEDAYSRLKNYLDRIESHFSNEKERSDILQDIESRLAEIFTERKGTAGQVISLTDVDFAIKLMGEPDEFAGAPHREESRYSRTQGPRRLYRDPDDRVLGGVCSGLGAYMGVDPVVIRVVFLLFFLFGVGLIVYLVLWIVVPEARTTAQKLEMRGEPVNASNIGNFFREEFESVKKSFRPRNRK